MKICRYCNKELKNKTNHLYHKECLKKQKKVNWKRWREENYGKALESQKKYNKSKKGKEAKRIWREKNKLPKKRRICKYCKKIIENAHNSQLYHKNCSERHKIEYEREYKKNLGEKSKKKSRESKRKWEEKNRNELNEKRKKEYKLLRKTNPQFRMRSYLRTRLWIALNNYTKTGKIMSSKKYGINYQAIIEHLKPFPKDLSKYHIDHIRPLCSFDLTNPEEIKKAFSPENHQLLLAKENLSKGKKMIKQTFL